MTHYISHMTSRALGAEQANRLQSAREEAGISYRKLADTTGIPEATLRRKLTTRSDLLTINELSLICDALSVEFRGVMAA